TVPHIGPDHPVVDSTPPGQTQHPRAQIDTVHPRQSLAAQPGTGTPGATPQVGCAGKVCPVRFAQAFQQGEVHRIEHGIVVGGRPAVIAGGHVHGAVVAGVEVEKVEYGTKYAEVGAGEANPFPPRLPLFSVVVFFLVVLTGHLLDRYGELQFGSARKDKGHQDLVPDGQGIGQVVDHDVVTAVCTGGRLTGGKG